jgi:hypothetical protein
MALITRHGEIWPRNQDTMDSIPGSKDGGQGIYKFTSFSMARPLCI